jgi:hypothetical protein
MVRMEHFETTLIIIRLNKHHHQHHIYINTYIYTYIYIYIYIYTYTIREGIETLGPRFIFPNDQSQNSRASASVSCAIRLDREFQPIVCSDREKDVVRFVFITYAILAGFMCFT